MTPSRTDAVFRNPTAGRPLAVRVGNRIGRPFIERVDLSSDAIVERAVRGMSPDACERIVFRDALDALCRSMCAETKMNLVGRISAREDTARLLRTQIRIQEALERFPEIRETPLPRPIYVIGWPRTGTTILHNLLARDPAHRALLYYEGFDPAAPARGKDTRKAKLSKVLRGLEYMAPGYRAIHAMNADSVEECVTIMYHTFSTPQFEFQYQCADYLSFLETRGTRDAYEHYREQLRMLQYYRPHGERWVLKDPAHLYALDTLLELFPEARFIWIHRDPARALGSIASLTAHTRALFSDAHDGESIGRDVLAGAWPRGLQRGLELRERLPADRFIDVRYADFMQAPMATMRSVYDALGLELSAVAGKSMERHLAVHPQGSEGVHRYTPEQFGIDPGTIRRQWSDYIERFGIPPE
ncbi:MAG: sulfotransferase [Candidatus Binatia bacterium]